MTPLIILHGALGCQKQMQPLVQYLEKRHTIYLIDFQCHGNSEKEGPITIPILAEQLQQFIVSHNLEQPLVFGYSMGGYIALYLETSNP